MRQISKNLESIVCKFFDKKTGAGVSVNKELAQEFHQPVLKKFKNGKFTAGLNIYLRSRFSSNTIIIYF